MILHITNDFNLTKVHKHLYMQLDKLGVDQKIFIPRRNTQQIGNNHFEFNSSLSEYIYSKKINIIHRIFFPYKISYLYNSLLQNTNLDDIQLTHATTLFSDGALAYKLYENYNIPYIVAVRNTDINFYFKKRKELIPLGLKILKNASKIIFISESNKKSFLNLESIKDIKNSILSKIIVINNGIDEFWLNNKEKYVSKEAYKFLFIGRFDNNKNVENLIDSLNIVRQQMNFPITLDLIGGTGNRHEKIIQKAKDFNWINYHGEIFNKDQIKEIFKTANYFSMISHTETFGLVYLEALSQGKPILYTKGQGVDGMFNFEIGEAVNSTDINDICRKINLLIKKNYSSINSIRFEDFSWPLIAEKYKNLYKNV